MLQIGYIILGLLIFVGITALIWYSIHGLYKSGSLVEEFKKTGNKKILRKLFIINILFYIIIFPILFMISFNPFIYALIILFHIRLYYLNLYKNRRYYITSTILTLLFLSLFLGSFGQDCDRNGFLDIDSIDRNCVGLEFTGIFGSTCIGKVTK